MPIIQPEGGPPGRPDTHHDWRYGPPPTPEEREAHGGLWVHRPAGTTGMHRGLTSREVSRLGHGWWAPYVGCWPAVITYARWNFPDGSRCDPHPAAAALGMEWEDDVAFGQPGWAGEDAWVRIGRDGRVQSSPDTWHEGETIAARACAALDALWAAHSKAQPVGIGEAMGPATGEAAAETRTGHRWAVVDTETGRVVSGWPSRTAAEHACRRGQTAPGVPMPSMRHTWSGVWWVPPIPPVPPLERPATTRVDLTPAQMRRLEAAGWTGGEEALAEWLAGMAESRQSLLAGLQAWQEWADGHLDERRVDDHARAALSRDLAAAAEAAVAGSRLYRWRKFAADLTGAPNQTDDEAREALAERVTETAMLCRDIRATATSRAVSLRAWREWADTHLPEGGFEDDATAREALGAALETGLQAVADSLHLQDWRTWAAEHDPGPPRADAEVRATLGARLTSPWRDARTDPPPMNQRVVALWWVNDRRDGVRHWVADEGPRADWGDTKPPTYWLPVPPAPEPPVPTRGEYQRALCVLEATDADPTVQKAAETVRRFVASLEVADASE